MIKNVLKGLTVVGLGLALTANTAAAQKPGIELGVGLLGFSMFNPDGDDNNVTSMNIGTASFGGAGFGGGQGVTAAWYLSDMIAIEPSVGFGRAKPEGGGDAISIMSLNVGVPIYLKRGWGKEGGFFVTPYLGTLRISSGGDSFSQTHFGANVGTKLEINDNVFWRVALGYDMGQENDDFPKTSAISGQFGINVYLH